ncbi:MAG: tRNA (adenosine(37)-N6)-threonylcarbamoyltransferase complex transferase subunit TsaD, partial [Zetaproteobacteria bacterium]
HLLAPGLAKDGLPPFPFVCLLVSGGHTMLVRVDGLGRYKVLGQTVDDAAGECFDKCARLLGCGYPGGPHIARMAQEGGDASRFALPRPMLNRGLDFSFSGLKTAVMYALKSSGVDMKDRQCRLDMAASIEAAIGDVLSIKAIRAARQEGVEYLVLAGGVAANRYLREQLHARARLSGIKLLVPDIRHCTDNAAMVAHAAWLRFQAQARFPEAWDARARWDLLDLEGTKGR